MAIKTIPTNIGGVQIPFNQIQGPLASLFSTDQPQNLTYPSDLASNPAMCHAVQFSVYDFTTELLNDFNSSAGAIQQTLQGSSVSQIPGYINSAVQSAKSGISSILSNPGEAASAAGAQIADTAPKVAKYFQSQTYRQQKGNFLGYISLYMPDTLVSSYNSNYDEISLTGQFGVAGKAVNAIADTLEKIGPSAKDGQNWTNILKTAATDAPGRALAASLAGAALPGNLGDLLGASLGVATNPQIQLLYKGVGLREFTLEFLFTPRDAKEARTTKMIVDSFNKFSLPDLASSSGQFLTPPQIFDINFIFTGQNGVISSIFQSAFNNIGLGFLNTTNPSQTIANGSQAKIFTIPSPCVLVNVNADYAPNGWAAYNDGNPVQTRLTLTFKETQIVTKQTYGRTSGAGYKNANEVTGTPYTTPSPTGPGTYNVGGSTMTITPLPD